MKNQSQQPRIGALVMLFTSLMPTSSLAQDGQLSSQRPVIAAKPLQLPWRQIKWPSIDYARVSLPSGGALYTMKSTSEKKFKLDIVFRGGTFALPEADRPAMGATIEMLTLGGAGKRSYQDIQNYALSEGLQLEAQVADTGGLQLSASGLAKDFAKVIPLIEDIILRPRFDPAALDLWKQMKADEFNSTLEASSGRKQQAFVQQEASRLLFGDKHFHSRSLFRKSTKVTKNVEMAQIKKLYPSLINSTGIRILLAGGVTDANEKELQRLVAKFPAGPYQPSQWIPYRPKYKNGKTQVTIIRKPDLSQSQVSFQIYSPSFGHLNDFEQTRMNILSEIYSSTGGVVGNDRFSKALRGDSGLSYSPHAQFDDTALEPNSNVASWKMGFQSPNESVGKAMEIASKTWELFREKGVQSDELERSRIAMMNRMLGSELTLFDRATQVWDGILSNKIPNPMVLEATLAKLEQEQSAEPLNELLSRFGSEAHAQVAVIFGNPSEAEVQKIKNLPGFEIAKEIAFSKLVEEFN
jgi:zinc protease